MERKLTAILSADVQGYSRLMGEDEVATIRAGIVAERPAKGRPEPRIALPWGAAQRRQPQAWGPFIGSTTSSSSSPT